MLKDVFDILFTVQNPNDANGVLVRKGVNLDGLKSYHRPGAKIADFEVVDCSNDSAVPRGDAGAATESCSGPNAGIESQSLEDSA